MRKKLNLKIDLEVSGIEVEETQHYQNGNGSGWYKFDYSFSVNGRKRKLGECDGSWSGQTKEDFIKALNSGWALSLAMERVCDQIA